MFNTKITVLTKLGGSLTFGAIINKYKTTNSNKFVTYNIEHGIQETVFTIKKWNMSRFEHEMAKHIQSNYIGIRF